MRSIVADIHDEQAVAKAIAHESYDVVALIYRLYGRKM